MLSCCSLQHKAPTFTEALLCSKYAPAWWVRHPSTIQPSAASQRSAGSVDLPALRRLWRALCPPGNLTFREVCCWVAWHSVSMGLPINPEGVWAELEVMLESSLSEVGGASRGQELSTSVVTGSVCAELQDRVLGGNLLRHEVPKSQALPACKGGRTALPTACAQSFSTGWGATFVQ